MISHDLSRTFEGGNSVIDAADPDLITDGEDSIVDGSWSCNILGICDERRGGGNVSSPDEHV